MAIYEDAVNGDWIKRGRWDVHNNDGTPVTTLAQLRSAFYDPPDSELKSMLYLPSAIAMPEGLRAELEAL